MTGKVFRVCFKNIFCFFKALRSKTRTSTPSRAKEKSRALGTPGYAPAFGREEKRVFHPIYAA